MPLNWQPKNNKYMKNDSPTAALIIIGNEILSGRTEDKNLNYIAKNLGELGIRFMEVRVVPDIFDMIIDTVNELRKKYTYIFTTGGIGPTHDDITTEGIARAFGRKIVTDAGAAKKLASHYKCDVSELNSARLKMAQFPEGYELIDNSISSAPGFRVENVFVMAGIPSIMQAMFTAAKPLLKVGNTIYSKELSAYVSESKIADFLTSLQNEYPDTDIGSYPFSKDGRYGTSLVIRGTDKNMIEEAFTKLEKNIKNFE